MPERFNGTVSKTVARKGLVSSNLTPSALSAKADFLENYGIWILEKIKKAAPKTEVIIATGFGVVETAVYAMKKGAYDFVLKPFDLETLKQKVRQAVDRIASCRECGRAFHA